MPAEKVLQFPQRYPEKRRPLSPELVLAKKTFHDISQKYLDIFDEPRLPNSLLFCEARIADFFQEMISKRKNRKEMERIADLIREELNGESIQDSKHLRFFQDTLSKLLGGELK